MQGRHSALPGLWVTFQEPQLGCVSQGSCGRHPARMNDWRSDFGGKDLRLLSGSAQILADEFLLTLVPM